MSDLNNTVKHNSYFEGTVQSLGLDTDKGNATVGVMKKGTYQFSTSTVETMIVVSGIMNIKLADGEWTKYAEQEKFEVAANSKFDIVCDTDVAYICYYA
ncbi:pyrimidine/purine nucleoside phosphorylase [Mucilaginibacter sp. L196]|uniref:pyrimidine/purine nucleoside phosphorylase n=1 Tax=Mucilaginibacter sp. L196 TaxID=1641870 RepID=UPI00131C0028|nr:pyrimidine/purine nucleoside phosphorylase [Mucilaginibacter sp. L196]